MSVVVFLTPAHAVPAASAHASAIPLIVLVAIMVVSLRYKVDGPSSWNGAIPLFLQTEGRSGCKRTSAVDFFC
jgi:hypothetical protein